MREVTKVYYKENKGKLSFYLVTEDRDYYLFTQEKRKGVREFFRGGVTLDRAIHHGIGKRDWALHRTMDRVLMHIKYLEKEQGITVLRQSQKKAA